jgi:hypothetical protein
MSTTKRQKGALSPVTAGATEQEDARTALKLRRLKKEITVDTLLLPRSGYDRLVPRSGRGEGAGDVERRRAAPTGGPTNPKESVWERAVEWRF